MPAYQTIAVAKFIDCVIDIFGGKRDSSEIFSSIVLIVLYILFTNLMPSIAEIISITGKNKMTLKIKDAILGKRASLEYMHIENVETQELINRVCFAPVENFSSGFNNLLSAANIIISSISLLIIIMASTLFSGIIIVAVSIPLFVLAMRTGKRNYEMGKESKKIQRRYSYLASILTDREYANERKLFGYSDNLQNTYSDLYKQSFKVEAKIEKRLYANMKSGSIVTLLIIALIVSILLPSLNEENMTIGTFIALINAIFSLVQTMSWQLSGTMSEHSRLREYLKDLNSFFELSEKKDACVQPCHTSDLIFKTLEFRNVSFKYPGTDIYVLRNCSFILRDGKTYSFVGVNSAGKSTITKLIVGLYDTYEGEILLNGKNIQDYDYAAIKSMVSILFQDFTTYSVSLKDNIIMANKMIYDASKVENIITDIGLNGLVHELKSAIDTPLGKIKEDSVDVSGGQWQRIAIARLLYSDAIINILDEPTASLDPIAESQVYEMFHRINNNRFTIYITHRLGAAKISDEILVLDGGRIIESGSHAQLMSIRDGFYRRMFDSQKSWYE
jgi:ATP-binding cassette subfamily B protein